MPNKVDYGIDAPGVIRNLLLAGGVAIALSGWVRWLIWPGIAWALSGGLMLLYSRVGKLRHRDRLLKLAGIRAGETVLDVGTGRGLLAVGAARLGARAIGIDVYSAQDLSGNSRQRTEANIAAEGVAVELRTEDATALQSFASASVDCVLSNLCLHNIEDRALRTRALSEIARVLKPGGRAVLSDFRHVTQYALALRELGLEVTKHGPYLLDTFPPLSVVVARKKS